jgi:hypothetical protein
MIKILILRPDIVHLQLDPPNMKLRNKLGQRFNVQQLTSKQIRGLLSEYKFAQPKITEMDQDTRSTYYDKLSRLVNVANKTKMLRLLHGDVYTAERMLRFGMTENDKCRRCLKKKL